MSPKKLKRDRIKIVIVSVIMILIIAISIVFCVSHELRFILKDRIAHSHMEKIVLFPDNGNIATVTMSLEDLKADQRVTFNDSMFLINTDHLLEKQDQLDIVEYKDSGVLMNSCITKAYENLAAAVKKRFNEKLYISSAYRTAEEQQRQILEEGENAQTVGASEHQAGLALDVYTLYHGGMGFLDCEAGQWVNENCGGFGFIIRYPYYGKGDTGISYEPWHLRYVGFPHSEIISRNSLTLEKYYELISGDRFYSAETDSGSWIISRQSYADGLLIPANFISCTVSLDNCGGYILSFRI